MAREEQGSDGFGHSLTDLMTSIAVIFILFFLVFVQTKQEEITKREDETVNNREKIFKELSQKFVDDNKVRVRKDLNDPLTLEIVLTDNPEALSFEKDEDDVSDAGEGFLEGFVPKLVYIVCRADTEPLIDSIIIEGHTDGRGKPQSNTLLSARRATAVLNESLKVLTPTKSTRRRNEPWYGNSARAKREAECFLNLAQATGRGSQERIEFTASDLDATSSREQDLLDWHDHKKRIAGADVRVTQTADGEPRKIENAGASRRVVVKVRVKSIEQRETPTTPVEGVDSD